MSSLAKLKKKMDKRSQKPSDDAGPLNKNNQEHKSEVTQGDENLKDMSKIDDKAKNIQEHESEVVQGNDNLKDMSKIEESAKNNTLKIVNRYVENKEADNNNDEILLSENCSNYVDNMNQIFGNIPKDFKVTVNNKKIMKEFHDYMANIVALQPILSNFLNMSRNTNMLDNTFWVSMDFNGDGIQLIDRFHTNIHMRRIITEEVNRVLENKDQKKYELTESNKKEDPVIPHHYLESIYDYCRLCMSPDMSQDYMVLIFKELFGEIEEKIRKQEVSQKMIEAFTKVLEDWPDKISVNDLKKQKDIIKTYEDAATFYENIKVLKEDCLRFSDITAEDAEKVTNTYNRFQFIYSESYNEEFRIHFSVMFSLKHSSFAKDFATQPSEYANRLKQIIRLGLQEDNQITIKKLVEKVGSLSDNIVQEILEFLKKSESLVEQIRKAAPDQYKWKDNFLEKVAERSTEQLGEPQQQAGITFDENGNPLVY